MIAISLELVNFVASFKLRPAKDIAASFERLGTWLTNRVKQAEAIERRSRRFPVIQFYSGAVVLYIDPIQKDALAPDGPQPTFLDHLRNGGNRFVDGLKDLVALPEQELIIPRFLDSVSAALKSVLASLERFATVDSTLFDTGARGASDLFGEAALAFRALVSSKGDLVGADSKGGFAAVLRQLMGPQGGEQKGPLESASALPDLLENVVRYIVGALELITNVPLLIKSLWAEASIFVRATVIDLFGGVEAQVLEVRRDVINLFYVDLREMLRNSVALAEAWSMAVVGFVSLFVSVAAMFSTALITTFSAWFGELRTFMSKVIDLYGSLGLLLGDLVEIDLMSLLVPVLKKELGTVWSIVKVASDVPTLRLVELAEAGTRIQAYVRFQSWLNQIKGNLRSAASGVLGDNAADLAAEYIESELAPIRDVLTQALAKPSVDVAETSAFTDLRLPGFPDLGGILTRWIAPLRGSVSGFIDTLGLESAAVVDSGIGALDALALRFDRAAASALRGPSAKTYLALAAGAAASATRLFPDADAQGSDPGSALGGIATKFDAWVARAGIEVVGAALPFYIIEMHRYFEERERSGEQSTVRLPGDLPKDFPTSPHIMAAHPMLGRTLVPRMTINARGRALDDALVDEVAAKFMSGVQAAHRSGLKVIADLQLASGV